MRRAARAEWRRQVDDDAAPDSAVDRRRGRDRGARLPAAWRVEDGPRGVRGGAAARQPRRHADGRAEPARVRAPLSRRSARAARGDRARADDGEARRPARLARRQALGRDATAAPDRRSARASSAAPAARRTDRRPRPAGAPGALGADRRAPLRGHDDSHVDALHRGGGAPRRHRDDHVARQGRRDRPAAAAHQRACRQGGRRGLRPAGASGRGRNGGRCGRAENATDGHEHLDPRRRRHRVTGRGRAAAGESRGRLRAPDRRGDRLMATEATPAPRRLHRLERPALTGVLVREVVNYSSYWRSSTFSSTVEPTIYLLAFGFGFGSLVSKVAGRPYVEFVGTGTVATAVLFSSAFPAMFGTFVKYQFQRTYDAILAAPVDTEELVTAEALWIATRAGVYGCVPMLVAIAFGLDPSWGMFLVPLIAWIAGFGWACFGIMIAGFAKSFENFNYVVSAVLTPLFLVAGTFFPLNRLPKWAQVLGEVNPLHHCVQLVRDAVLYGLVWTDLLRVGFLVLFALVIWRIAIHAMT